MFSKLFFHLERHFHYNNHDRLENRGIIFRKNILRKSGGRRVKSMIQNMTENQITLFIIKALKENKTKRARYHSR